MLTPDDEAELDQLRHQLALLDTSVLADLAADTETGTPLVDDGLAIGGWDDYDTLTAYGALHLGSTDPLRLYLFGGVLPAHRHKGIGTSLLGWQESAAAAWRDRPRWCPPISSTRPCWWCRTGSTTSPTRWTRSSSTSTWR